MGGELFLAAVGGCFMSNLLAAIRARDVDISGVHTEVIATLADSPTRFVALDLRVSFGGSHDPELLQKLVDIADRGCIMLNTLRATLELRIGLTAPASGSD